MKHLTAEQIRAFVVEKRPGPETAAILLHLGRCDQCYADWLCEVEGRVAPKEEDYDGPIDRALAMAKREARACARQEAAADKALETYLGLRIPGNRGGPQRLSGWPLCRKLLELSESYRHRDAGLMLHYAIAAQRIVGFMKGDDGPAPLLADMRARIAAEVANAYRVNDVLSEADDYMNRAESEMADGTGDLMLRARIMDLKASLRNSQRRFAESRQCLRWAQALYLRVGERHLAGRILITRGLYSGYDGDPEQGLGLLEKGLRQIDPEQDPVLIAIAFHTRLLLLNECGRFGEARAAYVESDLVNRYAGDELSLLKLRWEEGRIAAGLGELAEAAAAFDEVRSGFAARELPYKAGLVALELAIVWLRQGKTSADLSPLVRGLVSTFRACGVEREAVGAVLLLRQACERERLSLELVRSVVAFLRQLDRDPTARFELLPIT